MTRGSTVTSLIKRTLDTRPELESALNRFVDHVLQRTDHVVGIIAKGGGDARLILGAEGGDLDDTLIKKLASGILDGRGVSTRPTVNDVTPLDPAKPKRKIPLWQIVALIVLGAPIVLAIGFGAMIMTITTGEGFGYFLVLFLLGAGWVFIGILKA